MKLRHASVRAETSGDPATKKADMRNPELSAASAAPLRRAGGF
jgi:hypothetical protein